MEYSTIFRISKQYRLLGVCTTHAMCANGTCTRGLLQPLAGSTIRVIWPSYDLAYPICPIVGFFQNFEQFNHSLWSIWWLKHFWSFNLNLNYRIGWEKSAIFLENSQNSENSSSLFLMYSGSNFKIGLGFFVSYNYINLMEVTILQNISENFLIRNFEF